MTRELNIDLVVFDLDGTLVDSLGDLADAMNEVLESLGHPVHPRDRYRFFVGDGIEMLVRRALPSGKVEEIQIPDVVATMREEYSKRWLATTRPFPEIRELLGELRSRGIATAVLSNKPDDATRAIISELFVDHMFGIVRGAVDRVPLKPNPASVLGIVSGLGQTPQRSAFVGDTAVDMATGTNAGMLTVGVTWGFRDAEELITHGADHIIDRPFEILGILEGESPHPICS